MLRFRGHETCKTYINSDLEPQINYAPVRNEGFSVQTIIVSKSRYHCRRKKMHQYLQSPNPAPELLP